MSEIHSIMSGDGSICLIVDGRHYAASKTNPNYLEIRQVVTSRPLDESKLKGLLNINDSIAHILDGKVRVSLKEGKVWYNDTEFKDEAFCERILRLMSEGQDVMYLVKFLNNLGQNPEFRAIMETFKFLCNKGLPITPDGCFLAYKGVAHNFYDKWSGTIDNTPDGRRVEADRSLMCSDPSESCACGLHIGTCDYAHGWSSGDGRLILVKVNPRDVVCVPNHECEKMRTCGYWVLKDYGKDSAPLTGEVYDTDGMRTSSARFAEMEDRGMLDNHTNEYWDGDRTYSEDLVQGDDEYDPDDDDMPDEVCNFCDEPVEYCTCDYAEICDGCGEYVHSCICN